MVRVAGEAHIVIPIESQALGKRLWRIGFPFIYESIWARAHIAVDERLDVFLPSGLGRFLSDGGLFLRGKAVELGFAAVPNDAANFTLQFREKDFEVGQRVSRERTRGRHSFFRADPVPADDFNDIVAGTAFRYLAVAVHTDIVRGVVHIVLVHYEHLAQVIGFSGLPENLALQETQRGVVPARAAAVLILDAGNGQFLDRGEGLGGLGRCYGGTQQKESQSVNVLFHNVKNTKISGKVVN